MFIIYCKDKIIKIGMNKNLNVCVMFRSVYRSLVGNRKKENTYIGIVYAHLTYTSDDVFKILHLRHHYALTCKYTHKNFFRLPTKILYTDLNIIYTFRFLFNVILMILFLMHMISINTHCEKEQDLDLTLKPCKNLMMA